MTDQATAVKPLVTKTGAQQALAERMKVTVNYDELTNCMRCGFCLPACPTYGETGLEAASPRGRIALMKAVVDDLMVPDEAFKEQMNQCLECRACEPACPANVKYGQLIEQTRFAIEQGGEHRWWIKLVRKLAFKHIFPSQARVRMLGGLMRLYQKSGLRTLVRKSGLMRFFPAHMRQMEAILPDASSAGVVKAMGGTFFPAKGKAIARVGMFRGCIMDILFEGTNVNTVKLLNEAGFDVVIPETQNCCGALHAHSGEMNLAKELAKRNIAAFRAENVDYIVSNAGGCGALLMEYDHLLHDDPEWAKGAEWFAGRVKDISEIIMQKGNLPQVTERINSGPQEDVTITYQDSCHLRNVMRAGQAPRDLIRRVAHAQFVELEEAERCCGSAGIYNLVQPNMSMQLLDGKMVHVEDTRAQVLLASNPGCLLQMRLGIERRGLSGRMEAVHIVDFLYERITPNK